MSDITRERKAIQKYATVLGIEPITNCIYVEGTKYIRADRIEALIEKWEMEKYGNANFYIAIEDQQELLKEDKPDE